MAFLALRIGIEAAPRVACALDVSSGGPAFCSAVHAGAQCGAIQRNATQRKTGRLLGNRPVRNLVAGTGFEPVTFGL